MSFAETRTGSIDRHYLHQVVAERLRNLIRNGELKAGERINEAELCVRFGTSRTPLREAIKLLAAEGLLQLLPNRGARVASFSDEEISEIIDVVASLEATATELACQHITEAEIRQIEALHQAMVRAWMDRDAISYYTLNRDIHSAIVKASRNKVLAEIYHALNNRIQHVRYAAYENGAAEDHWAFAIKEHELILEHLKARATGPLSVVMRRHVKDNWAARSRA